MPATMEATKSSDRKISDLMKMSQKELDDLFLKSQPGPIPEGESSGTAIVWPGTFWSRLVARFVRHVAWQGKVFTRSPDGKEATLQNKIGPASTQLIVARVYYTPSWLDGKECIVLDYSKTSLFARKIRDEIRQVAPRLYLGKVWWGKKRLIDFALEFPK
jgi:hypothetical protein